MCVEILIGFIIGSKCLISYHSIKKTKNGIELLTQNTRSVNSQKKIGSVKYTSRTKKSQQKIPQKKS